MKKIKDIQRLLKNKKGELSLVFVFAMIFIFWLIMLIIDLFRLTSIHLDATSMVREVVDIIATQGGISTSAPSQYPAQSTYITSRELTKFVHDTMLDAGIEEGDIYITRTEDENGQAVTNKVIGESTNIEIDYGKPIEIRLRYRMNFISLPDNSALDNIVMNVTRKTASKYKHRNGTDWEGDGI